MAILSDLEKAINQRLVHLFDDLQQRKIISSVGEFCDKGGLDKSNFSKYFKEDEKQKELKTESVVKLTNAFNVNPDWLLNNLGDMYRDEAFFTNEIRQVTIHKEGVPDNAIPLYDMNINAGNVERLIDDNNCIPMVGWIHLEDVPASQGLIGVRAKGESMASYINSGDVMLIRKIEDWSFLPFGLPYVVIGTEMSVVKYLKAGPTQDEWTLSSHNEGHEDFHVPKTSVKHLFVVVKVLKDITY